MDDYLKILRHEFTAEDHSFLIKLRIDLIWDHDAFLSLTEAMRACCEKHSKTDTLERWLAEGFWYVQRFVRDWTQHPQFPRPYPADYYERAYRRLDDLAEWFFTGSRPAEPGTGFERIG